MPSEHERTLIVLRHGSAEDPAGPDRERALTERGRMQAAAAGVLLPARGLAPDVVVCSPARRTRETWAAVRAAAAWSVEASIDDAVYDADVGDLYDVLAALPAAAGTAMVVGHNPGCQQLVSEMSGRLTAMGTGQVVVLGWDGPWTAARAVTAAVLVG